MIQDLHSHTYYSYCGKDSPEDVIKNAISKGIELVGISDHNYGIVMNKPGFLYESEDEKVHMHSCAIKRYYEHIKTLAEKYKDYIDVWCGIEIATDDFGYMPLADGVDVSMFDYCLIEHLQDKETTVSDVFAFAERLGCKRTGLAHMDLPEYIESRGFDMASFLKKMKEHNIFWELNVNYDSIHGFREHEYVSNFFSDEKLCDLIRKSGIKMSVGFDGHRLEDYDAQRVIDACRKLDELSVPMIE